MIIKLTFMLIAIAIGGCAYIGKAEDAVIGAFVDQAVDYCKKPFHRRLGYYTIIAGDLELVGIQFGGFICAGDPELELEEDAPPPAG